MLAQSNSSKFAHVRPLKTTCTAGGLLSCFTTCTAGGLLSCFYSRPTCRKTL